MSTLLREHHGGWRPQKPDHRDRRYVPALTVARTPPAFAIDVSAIPVLDQGQQGSCTGHGSVGIVMVDQQKQAEKVVVPSRAMAYYDARLIEGTAGQDAGAEVRDAVGGIRKWGVCSDHEFPYNDQVFDRAPTVKDYQDAKLQEAIQYLAVNYPHINQTIATGYPAVYGFTVYESFESLAVADTGIVPIPGPNEQVLGGHCTYIWGYNSTSRPWKAPNGKTIPAHSKACRNSWGPDWGDHGDFYLPQYFWDHGLADDHWIIQRIGKG